MNECMNEGMSITCRPILDISLDAGFLYQRKSLSNSHDSKVESMSQNNLIRSGRSSPVLLAKLNLMLREEYL